MSTVTTEELAAIRELREQRDELAEALRDVIDNERGIVTLFNSMGEASPAAFSLACGKARETLAKMKP